MNKLKVKSSTGTVGYVNLHQNSPKIGFRFAPWPSAAQEKARVLKLGATLLGVRQK